MLFLVPLVVVVSLTSLAHLAAAVTHDTGWLDPNLFKACATLLIPLALAALCLYGVIVMPRS